MSSELSGSFGELSLGFGGLARETATARMSASSASRWLVASVSAGAAKDKS